MTDIRLIIGNKNYSSWSLRPWLYLKHFGIPFTETQIQLYQDGHKEKILQYSPTGLVPTLIDGEVTVWDSLAICEYAADRFPETQGWPLDLKARALARAVSAEMHAGFSALRAELPMNCRKRFEGFTPSPAAQADIDRIQSSWTTCRNQYGHEGPWLFGQFSIADCMYAPVVMRFVTYGVALNALSTAYINTVKTHPALVEWLAAAEAEEAVIEGSELNV